MVSSQRTARQVGAALRRVRLRRRQGQRQVAQAAGISPRHLAAYEHGRQQPSVAALAALLRVLNCSAEEYGAYVGPWGVVR